MSEMFAPSKVKLRRAQKHVGELADLLVAHSEAHPTEVEWREATETETAQLIVRSKAPPDCFGAIVGDVVHNLRAALDLMAVELVATQKGNTKKVYFPFCDTEDDLEEMIKKRKFHRAGAEAVSVLRSLKPFKGGNAALRALHDLDIQDKHHSLIPNSAMITTPEVTCDMSTGTPVIRLVEGSTPEVAVTFPDESPLAGLEVVPALHQLVQLVEGMLKTFAALSR